MASWGLPPATEETWRAYREWASCGAMVQTILSDLEAQIPGDFCPENQYVTAYNLGQLRVLQILAARLAESQTKRTVLPESSTHGQE